MSQPSLPEPPLLNYAAYAYVSPQALMLTNMLINHSPLLEAGAWCFRTYAFHSFLYVKKKKKEKKLIPTVQLLKNSKHTNRSHNAAAAVWRQWIVNKRLYLTHWRGWLLFVPRITVSGEHLCQLDPRARCCKTDCHSCEGLEALKFVWHFGVRAD